MNFSPYLFFDGRCEEAIEFYRSSLGASVQMLMRFKDNPGPVAPGTEEKVMHASLSIGETTLLVSDGHCTGQPNFQGFSLAISVPTAAEAERIFMALSEGGEVRMPLAKTFFSANFGMLADRFGVGWMVMAAP